MDLDPNWFYSTLAQSTAAIVGLMGGFLVARLLAQREEVAKLREDLRNRCKSIWSDIQRERQEASRVAQSMQGIAALLVAAEEAQTASAPVPNDRPVVLLTPTQYPTYSTAGMAGALATGNRPAVEAAAATAAAYRDALPADFEEFVEMLRLHGGLRVEANAAWIMERPDNLPGVNAGAGDQFFTWLPGQREIVRQRCGVLTAAASGAGEHLANFRARLVPRSLFVLLGLLGGLLIAGLVVPLFFLSAKEDASRPLLLAVFAVLASALMVYFAFELAKLRRADRLALDTF